MKKTIITLLLISILSSIGAYTVHATETNASENVIVQPDGSVIIMGDDSVEYYALEKEKVFAKKYTREELELYIRGALATTRVAGDILALCYTDDAEATGKELIAALGYAVEYKTLVLQHVCTYVFSVDEADMHDTMLVLLEAGFYAQVNGVGFTDSEPDGTVPPGEYFSYYCGDMDQNYSYSAKDYMMLKRIVLGTYNATDEQLWIADIDGDGSVNSKDYLMLKSHVMGNYTIKEQVCVGCFDGVYLGREPIPDVFLD